MRAFVALNLPAAERNALHDALSPIREKDLPVRWVRDDGVHLTLKFLGEVETAHVAPLGASLETVAAKHAPIALCLGGFGAFPSLRRANVLWVGIQPDPRLLALQRDLESTLFSLGYPRDQRPFRPHITVGRARNGARAPDVTPVASAFDFAASVMVTTIDLMQSHLGQNGSRYEPLLRASLGKLEA